MDWENARWVKLYCLETGTWLRLGWQGRTVALHLLRAVNASGVLSDLGDEPAIVLAELLRLPLEVVEPGLSSLLRTETITLQKGVLVWPKFMDAQRSRKSETQRKAEFRKKHRDAAISAQLGVKCPESGTSGDESGTVRPDAGTKQDKKSQKRKEEEEKRKKRKDKKESGTNMPLFGDEVPPTEEPDQSTAHIAIQVFAYLLAARKRCKPSARTVEPTETHLTEITRCLREGIDAKDLLHVVDVWEAQVKSGRQEMAHFDSVTPFRASNVGKYLQMGLDDASKPRGSMQPMQGYGRNPKPESDLEKLGRHFRERREARERGDVIDVESARMLDERHDNE